MNDHIHLCMKYSMFDRVAQSSMTLHKNVFHFHTLIVTAELFNNKVLEIFYF